MMDSRTDQWLQSTEGWPQTLYQICHHQQPVTDLRGDNQDSPGPVKPHQSSAAHRALYRKQIRRRDRANISSWDSEYLFCPGHCEALSPLKGETGHGFLADTEYRHGDSETKCRVRSVLIMTREILPGTLYIETQPGRKGLSCFEKTPEL